MFEELRGIDVNHHWHNRKHFIGLILRRLCPLSTLKLTALSSLPHRWRSVNTFEDQRSLMMRRIMSENTSCCWHARSCWGDNAHIRGRDYLKEIICWWMALVMTFNMLTNIPRDRHGNKEKRKKENRKGRSGWNAMNRWSCKQCLILPREVSDCSILSREVSNCLCNYFCKYLLNIQAFIVNYNKCINRFFIQKLPH